MTQSMEEAIHVWISYMDSAYYSAKEMVCHCCFCIFNYIEAVQIQKTIMAVHQVWIVHHVLFLYLAPLKKYGLRSSCVWLGHKMEVSLEELACCGREVFLFSCIH